jgi:superfamily II DNA or RNA helicase
MSQADADPADLAALHAELDRLRAENAALRARLHPESDAQPPPETPVSLLVTPADEPAVGRQPGAPSVTRDSPEAAKIALFRALFRGRDDVFAVRWQSKAGRSGYAPACAHEWDRTLCDKPKIKCAECPHRALSPMTDNVVRDHLTGRRTVGLYPILSDDTCLLLAVDFDKAEWQSDVRALAAVCEEHDVPACVEVSRSGNGAHVWLFFEQPLEARTARRLGSALLTRTTARRHELGLDSYDRLFPGQDTLPKGGFGNLIALPLQREPRASDRSVFVDADLRPAPDQWAYLSGVRRMSSAEVARALARTLGDADPLGARLAVDEEVEEPWSLPPSGRRLESPIAGPFPTTLELVSSNLVYVPADGLSQALQDRLIRLAAFDNPEFYRAQAMRLPTFAKPRLICCAEEISGYIALPRGCLEPAIELLDSLGIHARVRDERNQGRRLDATFHGELTPHQLEAAEAIAAHDTGVLSAATAFGKTVVAAWLIAARSTNTLVLVHRRQLMDQWRERLAAFLDLRIAEIGAVGGGRAKPNGDLDVAVIQSLNKRGSVADMVAEYGQVIVDECHHVSAFSFEQVLRQARARYVLGLTATPLRRDGHHPIITMQCGPIRYRTDSKALATSRPFSHTVVTRQTAFSLPPADTAPGIQAVYGALAADAERNQTIIDDVLAAVAAGRSPLVLTQRTDHRDLLAAALKPSVEHVFVISGGMSAKRRHAVAAQLATTPADAPRVIVATGRCVGEGYDDPRLDTLHLAMPVAWRGTLQQYAGRLHRQHAGKTDVVIFDYVDSLVPVLARMYQKRLAGYRAMGYAFDNGPGGGQSETQLPGDASR